jgi:penicillin-binding protein 1A
MGITSPLNAFPSEVIGGLKDCCTMLEMADAYATLASGGTHIPPTILGRVVFPDGSTDNLGDPPHKQVFSDGEAYAATKVLQTVIQSGTGTAANYGCPAAGKTGTAENLDNAWFVGYTPQLSTAVWVGYPQGNIPMGPNGFGGTLAAPIWHQYMSQASNGFCGGFPPPITPWSGVPFVGPRSNAHFSNTSGNTGGAGAGTVNGGGVPPAPATNNPQLFAQPPAPSGGGSANTGGQPNAPPGGSGGTGGGGSGGSHGSGGGHGTATGTTGGGTTGGGGPKKH